MAVEEMGLPTFEASDLAQVGSFWNLFITIHYFVEWYALGLLIL